MTVSIVAALAFLQSPVFPSAQPPTDWNNPRYWQPESTTYSPYNHIVAQPVTTHTPEPSTLIMIGSGVVALVPTLMRRKKED